MKPKYILFCYLFSLISNMLHAQTSENYYSYSSRMSHYYDSLRVATPDTLKVPGWRQFQRWSDFWRNRVYNSPTEQGTYDKYAINLQSAMSNPLYQPANKSAWNWQLAGDQNLNTHNRGIITSLWINPNNINEIYAGSNTSGLFRTINGGAIWECVTDNLNLPCVGVNDIAVHPTNTNIKYIVHSTPFKGGAAYIHKTTNNCVTWQTVLSFPANANKTACRIVLDPVNPNIIYALISSEVYRSNNSGATWQLIFNNLTTSQVWSPIPKMLLDIEFKPNDHNTVFITGIGIETDTTSNGSAELWVTHNASTATTADWQRIENGLPNYCNRYVLATDPNNPNSLYIGYSVKISNYNSKFNIKKLNITNNNISHIYDKNWGTSYSSPFAAMSYWCTGFELSPSNSNIMFCGGYNLEVLNMSTGAYTFFHVSSTPHPNFHVDQRVFKTAIANGKTYLFCGNDGGVSRYEYETGAMISCNGPGLDNNQYFGIGHSEAAPDFYIGGTQDNGVIGNGSGMFKAEIIGDAYEIIVDPIEPNICYATANGGSKYIAKSSNYGQDFNMSIGVINYIGGLNDRPFVMSPTNRNTLYVGYNELYRTTNAGYSWQSISDFHNPSNSWITVNDMQAIGLSKTDSNQIIVAFYGPTWAEANHSRLFKTTNGGQTWIDLTASLGNSIHWANITNIMVSPIDKNKIWITFGGYWTNSSGNTINKVWYSSNGGYSWVDVSNTLPDLPINCIAGIMQNNQYVPIIGNDIGIFKYDASIATWENISNGLPHVVVSDIETDFTNNMIVIGTYGRGIWKTAIPCNIPAVNTTISSNTHWGHNSTISGIITVENNTTLTITGTIALTEDSKFIVKPGAKLLINGGYLKGACSSSWRGIEVWGNRTAHQFANSSGNYQQGYLELNNATIENAVCAVELWKPGDWNSMGGIVKATNSTFKNNTRSVHALLYKNYLPRNPNTEVYYNATFKNCVFEINNNYISEHTFHKHIDLDDVNGVSFYGCDFILSPNVNGPYAFGTAIASYSSGFIVNGICNTPTIIPCNDYDRSTFTGFKFAIYANNTNNNSRRFSVYNSVFNNNSYGIYSENIKYLVVGKNEFNIGLNTMQNCPTCSGYGIFTKGCGVLKIDENTFQKMPNAPTAIYTGIHTENSAQANDIYKNDFTNLNYGNYAQLMNHNPIYNTEGLEFLCNTNQNNFADFYVAQIQNPTTSNSVQAIQGTVTLSAGNTFSQTPSNVWHFYNGGTNWVSYHYNGIAQFKPAINKIYQTSIVQVETANLCPSKFGAIPPDERSLALSDSAKANKQTAFNINKLNFDQVKFLYDRLKDGGSTEQRIIDINNTQPADMWALRNELLGYSPHLSGEVLKNVADQTTVFPDAVIFDIFASNPDDRSN